MYKLYQVVILGREQVDGLCYKSTCCSPQSVPKATMARWPDHASLAERTASFATKSATVRPMPPRAADASKCVRCVRCVQMRLPIPKKQTRNKMKQADDRNDRRIPVKDYWFMLVCPERSNIRLQLDIHIHMILNLILRNSHSDGRISFFSQIYVGHSLIQTQIS